MQEQIVIDEMVKVLDTFATDYTHYEDSETKEKVAYDYAKVAGAYNKVLSGLFETLHDPFFTARIEVYIDGRIEEDWRQ